MENPYLYSSIKYQPWKDGAASRDAEVAELKRLIDVANIDLDDLSNESAAEVARLTEEVAELSVKLGKEKDLTEQLIMQLAHAKEQGRKELEAERKRVAHEIFQFFASQAASVLFDGKEYREEPTLEKIDVFGGVSRKELCNRYRITVATLEREKSKYLDALKNGREVS